MPEEKYESLKNFAKDRPRDKEGHFIPSEVKDLPKNDQNPVTKFLHDETAVHKSNGDELVDIHVGNPLKKIQDLLEDIKRQKAFSFNIKGSLGVAGIALVLGTFGIFGGTKAFCSRGVQTKIGAIKTLSYQQVSKERFWEKIPFVSDFMPKSTSERVILIEQDSKTTRLVYNKKALQNIAQNTIYIATGEFDACSNELKLQDPTSLESMN